MTPLDSVKFGSLTKELAKSRVEKNSFVGSTDYAMWILRLDAFKIDLNKGPAPGEVVRNEDGKFTEALG